MHGRLTKIIWATLACLVLFVGCADSDVSPKISPVTSRGDRPPKLGLCAGCHGENGTAVLADYPNLTGQNQRYLANSLRAYQTGERQNSAMRAMVGTLTDAEIEELATHYANAVAND